MLSTDRKSYWVSLIVEELLKKNLVFYKDKDKAIRGVQRAMQIFMQKHNEIEQKVRKKIAGLKRNVSEHSSQWEVLYGNYYEEELSRSLLGR